MKLPKLVFPYTKSKSQKGDFVALDIARSSVKSIFFCKTSGKSLTARGVSMKSVYQDSIRKEIIKNVVDECQLQAGHKTTIVRDVIVGLSGPDVIGFVIVARTSRKTAEQEISEDEMEILYSKIRKAAYAQVQNRWSSLFAGEAGFEPLDLVITSTVIDDREVDDPIGLMGKTIQISVFCSYAKSDYYKWVVKTLKSIGLRVSAVTTTIYSQSKLLSEKARNYVLVDVGRDYTDVGVILGQNIVQTRSFEIGGEFFTRHLQEKIGLDHGNANGKKEAYTVKTLPEDEMDKVGDYLYEAGKVWRTAFGTVLTSMAGIKSFPETVYLSGGGSNSPVIEGLLYEEDWRQAIPFARDIKVKLASSSAWEDKVHDEPNLLSGLQMFVPVSIGIVRLELD